MLAARLHGARQLELRDEAPPVPAHGHHLVSVTAVGICGSDLHWYTQGNIGDATLSRPIVPGHEFAGQIVSGPRSGEKVAIEPARPCFRCDQCLAGNHNLCSRVRFAGHAEHDGGLREFVTWEDHALFTVPESLTPAETAMLEPLGVAIHAWDLGHHKVAEPVAVVGAGPIGLCAAQLAQSAGAMEVVVVEPKKYRRETARNLGITALSPEDISSDSDRFPVVFEFAGNDAAIVESLTLARPGGTIVVGGIPDDDRTAFPAALARRKGLTFRFSRRMNNSYPRAIALAAQAQVNLKCLVSHTFPLERVSEAFERAVARDGLKIMVSLP